MAYQRLLRFPVAGFKAVKKEEQVAIHCETGELVVWTYPYPPSHFKFSPDLSEVIYSHPDPKTFLEVARQGENAQSLFEEREQVKIKTSPTKYIVIGGKKSVRVPPLRYEQELEPRLRKKKRARIRIKSNKNDKIRQKAKKEKNYRTELSTLTRDTHIKPIEYCEHYQFCGNSSIRSNICWEPEWYSNCDFCKKRFETNVDKCIKLCEDCSFVCTCCFCSICEETFGKWQSNWREHWGIEHEKNCSCWKCLAHASCWNCRKNTHKTWDCPQIDTESKFIDEMPCFLCTCSHPGGPENCPNSDDYSDSLKQLAVERESEYIRTRTQAEVDEYYGNYDEAYDLDNLAV